MPSRSPEHGQYEPVPSMGTLFHGFAYIAINRGEYYDPANASDAPSYSPRIPDAAQREGLISVVFTTPFRDSEGDPLDASVHIVWNEGYVDKNVTLVRGDDDTITGVSLSQPASARTGNIPPLVDLDPVEAVREFLDFLDEVDHVGVTDDELRKLGVFLQMMQGGNG